MKAVVWHGKEDVRVDEVTDAKLEEPTDILIKVTSTAICGSDLHLYSKLGPFMKDGDIIGHEPMGIVEEVGVDVPNLAPGDRVVIPFNISCGHCWLCGQGLYSQCETTQNTSTRKGASLFGYTHLYGGVDGGQAEYLRVPQGQFGPVKVPNDGSPDERYLFLSDVLPTAWQAVEYAAVPQGGTLVVYGLGPIGQMAARIALHRGAGRVIGFDLVPERLEMADRWGVETYDVGRIKDPTNCVWELTSGRGADSVIDAVGMESEDNLLGKALQDAKVLPDRLRALHHVLGSVRRGGTVSLAGVYVGAFPLFPIGDLFDKQVQIRMGQANVRAWTDKLLPLLNDDDPLGVERDFVTHPAPLDAAPELYKTFQQKQDGCIKVVLKP